MNCHWQSSMRCWEHKRQTFVFPKSAWLLACVRLTNAHVDVSATQSPMNPALLQRNGYASCMDKKSDMHQSKDLDCSTEGLNNFAFYLFFLPQNGLQVASGPHHCESWTTPAPVFCREASRTVLRLTTLKFKYFPLLLQKLLKVKDSKTLRWMFAIYYKRKYARLLETHARRKKKQKSALVPSLI